MHSLRIHPFAKRLIKACRYLHANGLAYGPRNAIIARNEDLFWSTPDNADFAYVIAEDLLVRWPNGEREICADTVKPHADIALHRSILDLRPDVSVIIQAFLPHVMAWVSMPHQSVLAFNLKVGIAEQDGTQAELLELLKTNNIVIHSKYAVLVLAQSPEEAVNSLGTLEAAVRAALLAAKH
jgi:ribulose-5-phosphate 4-epimerase/fuculose-1-phosphate aldolase